MRRRHSSDEVAVLERIAEESYLIEGREITRSFIMELLEGKHKEVFERILTCLNAFYFPARKNEVF